MSAQDDEVEGCGGSPINITGCHLPVDPALSAQGWQWRCNADGGKLKQVVDSYRELGFAVRIEPLDLRELSEHCAGCRGVLAQASAVFVKKG